MSSPHPHFNMILLVSFLFLSACSVKTEVKLLNVSYDPTRELYAEYNKAFTSYWKNKTGEDLHISSSHDGSGKQSRAIQDGTPADVATLALSYDIDAIYEKGGTNSSGKHLIPKDWQQRLPNNSCPYTSTIVFLVRKGNPKHIRDWDDLIRHDVSVITSNPKTAGGARWTYLAAWAYANKRFHGDQKKDCDFIGKIYGNALKNGLAAGARAGTINFTERKLGDVSITWENEALLILKNTTDQYEIVIPSLSILTEPPVTLLDATVDEHKTRKQATAYLEYLYSPEGQEIIAKNFYRPIDPVAAAKYSYQFKPLQLATIADFGGWTQAQKIHFSNNGIFDHILKKIR
jgi:sulfate transport system substrate-binding protein